MTTPELHAALNECGFYRTGTGGGCDAMIRLFGDVDAWSDEYPDAYLIMTQAEDPSAPGTDEDVCIGFYAENGSSLTWTCTAQEALNFARSLTYNNRV